MKKLWKKPTIHEINEKTKDDEAFSWTLTMGRYVGNKAYDTTILVIKDTKHKIENFKHVHF